MEENKKPLIEQVKELSEFKSQVLEKETKGRKIRIPRKAKVRGQKIRKGYIGILKIDENRNISAEKQRILGSAYRTSDGLYHATNGEELFWWQGKFPIIIQPTWKANPLSVNPTTEKNETYGQPYIKAKMLADTIKVKSKGGNIIIWILVAGAALFGINYLMGGGLFG